MFVYIYGEFRDSKNVNVNIFYYFSLDFGGFQAIKSHYVNLFY